MNKWCFMTDFYYFVTKSCASEMLATTLAHHATARILGLDLSLFEDDILACDKKLAADGNDATQTEQQVMKGTSAE